MRYYYDFEQKQYISETELEKLYNSLKAENPAEYSHSFSNYKLNCLARNNGSLITLSQRKTELEKELFDYMLSGYEIDMDFTEETEAIRKELDYIRTIETEG